MLQVDKDYYISRIAAGYIRCLLQEDTKTQLYLLKNPNLRQKYEAEEFYRTKLNECYLNGFYDEVQYLEFLISRGIWSLDKEDRLTALKTEIEDAKIELFECQLKSNTKKKIRLKIKKLVGEFGQLTELKNSEIHQSAAGLAGIAKLRYLVGICLHNSNHEQVFNEASFWDLQDCGLLDKVVNFHNHNKIKDAEYRELARTEPWRAIWSCRKACGENVFGTSSIDLTEEQRNLVYWSLLYDNIYEHPDCPNSDVIEDDDAVDGFLLKKHREKESNSQSKGIEESLPQSIRKHQEVFIPAETIEDARKIENLNSETAKATKIVREKKIKEKGAVNELDLPDVSIRLKMEATQKISERMKGMK